MYVKQNKVSEVNFLASSKFQNFTRQISNTGVTANEKGRKIVPAGTVYKNENGVAIGLLFHDVDVTEGPQPGAVMYQGIVLGARLPAEVSDADKATMKGIIFKDEYETQDKTDEISYKVTSDTTYATNKDYFKRVGSIFSKMIAGTTAEVTAGTADYTVATNVSGVVYEIDE